MEDKILNIIKNKKNGHKDDELSSILHKIKREKEGVQREETAGRKKGGSCRRMSIGEKTASGRLNVKKESLTDLLIYKYYVSLSEPRNSQIKSRDDVVAYLNGDTVYLYERDGRCTQLELASIIKYFRNKTGADEHERVGSEDVQLYDVNRDYLVLRIGSSFVFYQIIRGDLLTIKESFVLPRARQVLLFSDYFLYVDDKVIERKLSNHEERVILNENVDKIFVIEDMVYYKVNDEIRNKMNSKTLKGDSLIGLDDCLLLRGNDSYYLLDSEYAVMDKMAISDDIFVLDNMMGIVSGNVINWLSIEDNKFKIYGSTSVGNNVTVSGDKKDNKLYLYVIRESSGDEEQSSESESTDEEDVQAPDGKTGSAVRQPAKKNGPADTSSSVSTKGRADILRDRMERISISDGGAGDVLYERIVAHIDGMFARFDDEMKRREAAFKKKQAALLVGISEQMNKCFGSLADKIGRADSTATLVSKKEIMAEFRKLFSELLLPCVEASIEEMRLQVVGEMRRIGSAESRIETLLGSGKVKEACAMALDGSDDEFNMFVSHIDTDTLKQLSTSSCVLLADRCSFLLDNGDDRKIEVIKKILGIIDVHEFEENDFIVFNRVLKRLNKFSGTDHLLSLLVETQRHLFGKAVAKMQMKCVQDKK